MKHIKDAKMDSRRTIAAFLPLQQIALLILDDAAHGLNSSPETNADVLLGAFEVEETIFDWPRTTNRNMNKAELEAVAHLNDTAAKFLGQRPRRLPKAHFGLKDTVGSAEESFNPS